MLKIRKASEADISAVADMFSDIHTAEEKGDLTTGWVRSFYPTEKTAADAVVRGELFVGEDGSNIVGTCIIDQSQADEYAGGDWQYDAEPKDVMVLHTLAVSPGMSGRGYGSSFVKFYESYAAEHGCHYMRMDTNERNSNARALYKNLGYREAGIVSCVFNGIPDVKLVLLEKKLGI